MDPSKVRAFIFACSEIDISAGLLSEIREMIEYVHPNFALVHSGDVEVTLMQFPRIIQRYEEASNFSESFDDGASLELLSEDPVMVVMLCHEDCTHMHITPPCSLSARFESIDRAMNGFKGRLLAWHDLAMQRQDFKAGALVIVRGVILKDDEDVWALMPLKSIRVACKNRLTEEQLASTVTNNIDC